MQQVFLYIMSAFYVFAGVMHFVKPGFYFNIMPQWMPWHATLIYASGVAEILLGLLLIPEATRQYAAWLIIAMLIVFFTVHIDMVVDFYRNSKPGFWLTVVRIPLQFVLIWWAWLYTR